MKQTLLLIMFTVLSVVAQEKALFCPMLLSEEEQKATGYDRQRKMYPLGSRQRLSAAALKDGSDFLKKKELLSCSLLLTTAKNRAEKGRPITSLMTVLKIRFFY